MGISYPTVKNRLDKLLITLGLFKESEAVEEKDILDTLERGEITAAEAIKLMKEEIKKVLEMLEEKKITSEEAAELLDALREIKQKEETTPLSTKKRENMSR